MAWAFLYGDIPVHAVTHAVVLTSIYMVRYPQPTSKYKRIRIGHVGYVRDGRFELLFDANRHTGRGKDRRVPGRDVPLNFVPLPVGAEERERIRRSDRHEVVESERAVQVEAGVDLSCVLLLPML